MLKASVLTHQYCQWTKKISRIYGVAALKKLLNKLLNESKSLKRFFGLNIFMYQDFDNFFCKNYDVMLAPQKLLIFDL